MSASFLAPPAAPAVPVAAANRPPATADRGDGPPFGDVLGRAVVAKAPTSEDAGPEPTSPRTPAQPALDGRAAEVAAIQSAVARAVTQQPTQATVAVQVDGDVGDDGAGDVDAPIPAAPVVGRDHDRAEAFPVVVAELPSGASAATLAATSIAPAPLSVATAAPATQALDGESAVSDTAERAANGRVEPSLGAHQAEPLPSTQASAQTAAAVLAASLGATPAAPTSAPAHAATKAVASSGAATAAAGSHAPNAVRPDAAPLLPAAAVDKARDVQVPLPAQTAPSVAAPDHQGAAAADTPGPLAPASGDARGNGLEAGPLSAATTGAPAAGQNATSTTAAGSDAAAVAASAVPGVAAASPASSTATTVASAGASAAASAPQPPTDAPTVVPVGEASLAAAGSTAPAAASAPVDVAALAAPAEVRGQAVVQRIAEIARTLENAPPPRSILVEMTELPGLRIQVRLAADGGVHVTALGSQDAVAPLTSLGRDLADALGQRGLSLGEFSSRDDTDAREATTNDGDDRRGASDRNGRAPQDQQGRPTTPPSSRRPVDAGAVRL